MDIGWSMILHHKILKESQKKEKENKNNPVCEKIKKIPPSNVCGMCGQNPYFCQCSSIREKLRSVTRKK